MSDEQEVKLAGEKGRIKVRVIEVEVDGSDKTLQDAFQAIAGALAKSSPAVRQMVLADRTGNGKQESAVYLEEDSEPQIVVHPPRVTRKVAVPTYKVKDIELKEGAISWEDFSKAKSPPSDLMRHLVAAYWLKKFRNYVSVDASDAFTLYKAVKWTPAKNMYQQFKDLTHKRQFMRTMGDGLFDINHLGEAEVEKMGSAVDVA